MSYSFTVKFAPGKEPAVEVSTPGHVPDGEYHVSGHEDEHGRSLAVTASDQDAPGAARAVISTYTRRT